jgi:hypothetical protein
VDAARLVSVHYPNNRGSMSRKMYTLNNLRINAPMLHEDSAAPNYVDMVASMTALTTGVFTRVWNDDCEQAAIHRAPRPEGITQNGNTDHKDQPTKPDAFSGNQG